METELEMIKKRNSTMNFIIELYQKNIHEQVYLYAYVLDTNTINFATIVKVKKSKTSGICDKF